MDNVGIKFLTQNIDCIVKLKQPTLQALHRLNLYTIRDLIFHLPINIITKYIDPDYTALNNGDEIISEVTIKNVQPAKFKQPTRVFCINNLDQRIVLVYFNKLHPFIYNSLKVNTKKIIAGKIEIINGLVQIVHPDLILNKNMVREYEPIYPLTFALNNSLLRNIIIKVLAKVPQIKEWLPDSVIKVNNLTTFNNALNLIHNPTIDSLAQAACTRLAFDELLANQLKLMLIRQQRRTCEGRIFKPNLTLQQQVLDFLKFKLTNAQDRVIKEIEADQASNIEMLRMLQGDVGSGKTLVALLTILNVIHNNSQAAIMAPTELVANQHFVFFKKALTNFDIKVELLTSNIKGKARSIILQDLEQGVINILIGTHALFQEKVKFADLGYIIIDEQHRFGVKQRLDLMNKGNKPDVLIMSATPIPRTLNLMLYGDMDISKLDEKPVGRLPIITNCINEEKLIDLVISLKEKIAKGEKIFWVCPLIEQKSEDTVVDSIPTDELIPQIVDTTIRSNVLKLYYPHKVGVIHGKMTTIDKEKIMEDFIQGDIAILVSTTVIEVGVDVPSATIMIVENAEMFGLAQLHQLRGRVGRGTSQAYCILIHSLKISNIAKERLKLMKNSNDGFYLAEQDLKLRGGGEILGMKQSGEHMHKFLQFDADNYDTNVELLNVTNQVARDIVDKKIYMSDEQINMLMAVYSSDDENNSSILN